MENKKSVSRRDFIKGAATAAVGLTILPSKVIGGLGYMAPSDKLNIAGIGIGGKGRSNLANMKSQNIVALCDVDWKYAAKTFNDFPKAKKYKDYREVLERKDIDAVMVATPDHTHAMIAKQFMEKGCHAYLEKPLTHSVYESRVLTETARKYKVATQMGNQGNSSEDIRRICEWVWDGAIGEIKVVHVWTNRPIWPQGLERPTEQMSTPSTLDWDLFLGPAKYRPYHSAYTPWNWRAWWDFGTGALGDMGCHLIDPAFLALKLGNPESFEASSSQVNTESAPIAGKVTYYFPERKALKKVKMPAVKLTWYDGGLTPERPLELPEGEKMGDWGGGCLFIGSKGKIVCGTYARNPKLLGVDKYEAPKVLRRVTTSHEMDWVRSCKESYGSRVPSSANFDYAGPFNEVVVMGNLAVRLQDLKRRLYWDADKMMIKNISDSDKIKVVTTDTFKVVDGHPHFNTKYATINAKDAATEYIKHNYRKGWKL